MKPEELENESPGIIEDSFVDAFKAALRQWKMHYDIEGCHAAVASGGDDGEPDDDDYDLSTARHGEGDLYRWCARELKRMEENKPRWHWRY